MDCAPLTADALTQHAVAIEAEIARALKQVPNVRDSFARGASITGSDVTRIERETRDALKELQRFDAKKRDAEGWPELTWSIDEKLGVTNLPPRAAPTPLGYHNPADDALSA